MHAATNTPAMDTQTTPPKSVNAADISLKANERYSTTLRVKKCISSPASGIPLKANECCNTAATDGTTTIPVTSNECYVTASDISLETQTLGNLETNECHGIVATDGITMKSNVCYKRVGAAQLDSDAETEEYDYI